MELRSSSEAATATVKHQQQSKHDRSHKLTNTIDRSHKLDYGRSHKHTVADLVLKRGRTPILFALLGLTAKN